MKRHSLTPSTSKKLKLQENFISWPDLPAVVQRNIVSQLDLQDRFNLQRCSKIIRDLVQPLASQYVIKKLLIRKGDFPDDPEVFFDGCPAGAYPGFSMDTLNDILDRQNNHVDMFSFSPISSLQFPLRLTSVKKFHFEEQISDQEDIGFQRFLLDLSPTIEKIRIFSSKSVNYFPAMSHAKTLRLPVISNFDDDMLINLEAENLTLTCSVITSKGIAEFIKKRIRNSTPTAFEIQSKDCNKLEILEEFNSSVLKADRSITVLSLRFYEMNGYVIIDKNIIKGVIDNWSTINTMEYKRYIEDRIFDVIRF